MNEKIETIRQTCIKANPEIVELKFGCEAIVMFGAEPYRLKLIYQKPIGTWVTLQSHTEDPRTYFHRIWTLKKTEVVNEKTTIVGRTIRLADVVLAQKEINNDPIPLAQIIAYWNLRTDDLTQQSSECIDFLYDLLNQSQ